MDVVISIAWVSIVYFVIVPALTYLRHEAAHREGWRRRILVEVAEPTPGGPFRDEGEEGSRRRYVAEVRGAPRHVKVVVVTSLVLGHMFLPGLLAGLFGLPFYGVGLVSIPGLWLAAAIYGNAFGLLRCAPQAAARARRLERFAIGLNVAVLAVVVVLSLWAGPHPLVVLTAVYACISIAHAHGLGRAADAVDAVHCEALEVVAEDELPREVVLRGPTVAAPSSVAARSW